MIHRISATFDPEPIIRALELLPRTLADLLGTVRFVCGVDPIFVGLHRYEESSRFAHCCYGWHLTEPSSPTTVVLPENFERLYKDHVGVVIHELAHALDELTGFALAFEPVTTYARSNRREAFAEAFTTWVKPDYLEHAHIADLDRAGRRQFEALL